MHQLHVPRECVTAKPIKFMTPLRVSAELNKMNSVLRLHSVSHMLTVSEAYALVRVDTSIQPVDFVKV